MGINQDFSVGNSFFFLFGFLWVSVEVYHVFLIATKRRGDGRVLGGIIQQDGPLPVIAGVIK